MDSTKAFMLALVVAAALSLLGGGAGAPAGAQASPIVVDLGHPIHDVQGDPTSGRVYVSLPQGNAVVALDASTGTELDRITLTDPHGLTISSDGAIVYVALATEGAVAQWSVDTGDVTTIVLPELGHLRTWDVDLIDDATIAVVANGSGSGCVLVVDLVADTRSCAAGGEVVSSAPEIRHRAGRLFVGEFNRYHVFDLAIPGVPVVETGLLTNTPGFGVSLDGDTIVAQFEVIDVSAGIQRGTFDHDEVPLIDEAGRLLTAQRFFDGVTSSVTLRERDIDSLEAVAATDVVCPVSTSYPIGRVEAGPNGDLAIAFNTELCLTGPVTLGPIVEPPLRSGPVFDIGAVVSDAVIDDATGRAYLSLFFEDQVIVIDTTTGDELERRYFHRPHGLALSPDGSTLHVALSASQAIAHWNLSTGLVAERPILELTDPRVLDVIEPRPGLVVVSADGTQPLVAVEMATGTVRPIGGGLVSRAGRLAADADSLYVGLGGSPNSLFKLDLNDPAIPVVLEDDHGSVSGTYRVRPEPDGSLLLANGQRITSDTFMTTGWFGSHAERGADGFVYTAGADGITRHDPVSSEPLATAALPCELDPFSSGFPRHVLHTANGFLVILDPSTDRDVSCLLADPLFEPIVADAFAVGPNAILAGEVRSVAVDAAGGRAFVSIPESHRVSVIDLATGNEIDRKFFRWPGGVEVSVDGSRVFVALGAGTGIAVWELDTDTVSYVRLPELGVAAATDVLELGDGRLLVQPARDGLSFFVVYDPVTETAVPSVDRNSGFGQEMIDVGDGRVLVTGDGILDVAAGTITTAPTFVGWGQGSVIEPGGATVLNTNGERIDLSTFEVVRTTEPGRPVYGDDGTLFMYQGPAFRKPVSTMRVHASRTLQEVATAPVPCQLQFGSEFVANTGPGRFFLAGGLYACVVDGVAPEPSYLRATTSPPLPSQVVVDGVARDTWGLTWAEIGMGTREICFTDIVGFTTPACSDVAVGPGTTVYEGAFVQRGWIRATSQPPVPTTITIDGAARNDWGAWVDVEPGTHEVCWGDVDGYAPPACQSVDVVAGETVDAIGTFTVDASTAPTGHGFLRVTTDPPVASMISVDGVERDRWGLTWMKLPTGSTTVCFGDVGGFATPNCERVRVFAGATTSVVGTFEPLGSLRVTTDPAVPATVIVDGIPRNDWGMWTALPAGSHEVCWQTVGGEAPACTDVFVEAGSTATVVGQWPQ